MPPRLLGPVHEQDLKDIRAYLSSHNLGVNNYRTRVGKGVSQCLGIVGKRCMPPNLSRMSWLHPELHHLLLVFAEKYVTIPFTSIQVNCNYNCAPHKDTGNIGESYIIAFGPYFGGAIHVNGFDYDIRLRGLLFDGSQLVHSTKPWYGQRYSLVFHTIAPRGKGGVLPSIYDFKAILDDGHWVMKDLKKDCLITPKEGMPHPLRGIKKSNLKKDVRPEDSNTKAPGQT